MIVVAIEVQTRQENWEGRGQFRWGERKWAPFSWNRRTAQSEMSSFRGCHYEDRVGSLQEHSALILGENCSSCTQRVGWLGKKSDFICMYVNYSKRITCQRPHLINWLQYFLGRRFLLCLLLGLMVDRVLHITILLATSAATKKSILI